MATRLARSPKLIAPAPATDRAEPVEETTVVKTPPLPATWWRRRKRRLNRLIRRIGLTLWVRFRPSANATSALKLAKRI